MKLVDPASLFARAVRALRGSEAAASAPAALAAPLPVELAPPALPEPPRSAPVQARGPRGMRIRRMRGRDLVEVLERAARELGPDALVLSREPAPGGGVTVALGIPAMPLAPRREREDPGLRDVRRLLERGGASRELVERVLLAVEASGSRGAFAIDAAAEVLGRTLSIAPSPRARGRDAVAPVLAFVGPTGVGKTTTLAKLAARLVRSGRRVALAAMDGGNVGAKAQLETYGRLLQAPVRHAADGEQLARAVEASRGADLVLVDTSGRSPRDVPALRALAAELESARARDALAPALDVYLTLPATSGRAALDEALLGFAEARPTALVLTKLDETAQSAPALEFAAAAGLPTAFLCDGAEIAQHLHRTSPERVADLFLRGRLA
jgi:flagellar biosynthesis GTPase FlhF